MSSSHGANNSDLDSRFTALETNIEAIRAVASAVKGTIGPKGLDTMLVDQMGDIVITNDGVTILNLMEVNHPAARMLINIARVQQEEIGDGTTTATLMAGEMLSEGLKQVTQGVPIARVIEGLRIGLAQAIEEFEARTQEIDQDNYSLLTKIALVAGREYEDIANLVVKSAQIMGSEKLLEPSFKLSDSIKAIEGANNEVFVGTLINKERMNKQSPKEVLNAKILIIDDALEPEAIDDAALATEKGFTRFMELREEFKQSIEKIVESGANVVLVDRGVNDLAEEILIDNGIMVVERVANKELQKISKHTKAKMIKRTGLNKQVEAIKNYIGSAEKVYEDEKLENIRILNGIGEPIATVIVSASTSEVVGERERIAKDAASSVQATFKKGFVPGGGSIDLYIARKLESLQKDIKGMTSFGVKCVASALEKPFMQIATNAGYNPLEKIGNVTQAQVEQNNFALGIDCDTGDVKDMLVEGIIDPTLVKIHALKAAGEVAEAILRIDTIIRKKQESNL
ncbi:Chaperonin GroEL (HSP60 family) [Desulfonispora thiosulfatigenes DSM 11270]|uniref:Chaperonin GroEL (HSP60 family) n=1 Tax=Desulfonispora thiosulfatigenes DSM 11270 TaxID=656914 RepID=A0A1W1VBV5_DESTI|nr:TCP-1/cpn60 chaperonin family protein [Desulfonispora thiosulfatigenes]SMB90879.1 Chaperonin GroEL (HSP60 family) [Desulfonispora thiosulfatigenes DSM 11270]